MEGTAATSTNSMPEGTAMILLFWSQQHWEVQQPLMPMLKPPLMA